MKSLEINMCKIGLFIFSMSFEEYFLNFFYKVPTYKVFFFFYDLGFLCPKNYFSNSRSQISPMFSSGNLMGFLFYSEVYAPF